ncbi:hypothetical protein C343_02474 [Cryptococcus neoformans C23]|uniref:Major facilitator superfamily (MFS) profile domain-containing protein n=2 Tax=Cryptococcus neoformans TaxID=5207 RepID=A0A854QH13_CRYNE|nr:hypothetical protein CNAG_05130 [Cryptococcus neoformans var. grubii H99]AUB24047.1 hypothetical protein CKF44_05130 [Cryptococcus neoformans var. grubii]OWZ33513.1 hypothetical protein C347_02542 [Cryptococcus neoformans var. grubii AD2-60a]OWZ45609.1 hypothetical protein C343_02474 [Cryptococcus neoformans var. grubii C23]OWZ55158.1 hypothetical protein C368_02963 [Cryptococcus neoformans var. grubii 125.91]OWZ78905.1 hypothetical protein C365_02553 [Cryptococcus neoformans var. grubii Bt|eukprot:XP_012048515.1 hypothetical protein CNAG_05130 [Cryptococcus neoformans var. grubii H99]
MASAVSPGEPSQPSSSSQGPINLGRQASRLSNTLTHIRSIDAYPPRDDGMTDLQRDQTDSSKSAEKQTLNGLNAIDIEHLPVDNDPRKWSDKKKWTVLMIMTFAMLGPMMAPSIYNPVISDVREDLHATESELGLSISLYILFQGCTPVLWAAIAELNGRKTVYLVSYTLYVIALVVASRANSMPLLIVMRILQSTGSGPTVSLGAGSLADMYETHERGAKLGLFYGVPMIAPAVAPLIGGALGQSFGWRSVFYFLAVYAFIMLLCFIVFPDSWRRQRSRVYQRAVAKAMERAENQGAKDLKREIKLAKQSQVLDTIPATPDATPGASPGSSRRPSAETGGRMMTDTTLVDVTLNNDQKQTAGKSGKVKVKMMKWLPFGTKKEKIQAEDEVEFKPTFRDLNPLPSMALILKRPTNLLILISSALSFSAQYTIVYTASITLGKAPYSYGSLKIGLVVLAFGIGNILASLIGGKYSDMVLKKLKKKNGGVGNPEMRLRSTVLAMPILVASFLAYAWTAEKKVHIAALVVCLFFAGFSLLWIYSSTLAYVVDANPGASSSAVSCNSMFRGICACVMSQVATPIQNGIGDGGLYTLFAGILAFACACNLLLMVKGEQWRSPEHRWPWQKKREEGMIKN